MSDETLSTSQSGEDSAPVSPERDPETEALYAQFDLKPATAQKKEIEFPDLSKGEVQSEGDQPPAKEEQAPEPKKLTVKFNKEDIEVDVSDDKLPEYVQKALALDKERERVKQSQTDLDRAAKLLGYKDHADLSANLDRIEQEKQQQQIDQFAQLKQKVIDDLIYNGVDEEAAKQYAEANPLVQQARETLQEREQAQQEREKATQAETWTKSWNDLYSSFPDLVESSKAFNDGSKPDWYTTEMESMVSRGLTPKEAYTLLNMDKIQTQSAKKTEQKLIKQQHLGARSIVEGQATTEPDEVTLLPAQMELAAEFGVKLDGVKRQQKLLTSRR